MQKQGQQQVKKLDVGIDVGFHTDIGGIGQCTSSQSS